MANGDEHKSNGYRAQIIINAAVMVPVAGILVTLWADVRQLKTERDERVSAERIAKIEGEVDALTREVRRNDIEGQRDRERLWHAHEQHQADIRAGRVPR